MRKTALAYSLILLIWLTSVLNTTSFLKDAYAIPNSGIPAPDGHPHSCGNATHPQFIDGTVTWENGSGIWVGGNLTNPDSTCHQHHCSLSFGGLSYPNAPPGHWPPREGANPNEVYEAFGCWDNETFRPGLPWAWQNVFREGHGFINEFPEAGGGSNCIPDYYFSPIQSPDSTNPGAPCNWPVIDGVNATTLIREAFGLWSNIYTDKFYLATGIAFEETAIQGNAEVVVYWDTGVPDPARTNPTVRPLRVRFDNGRNWNFSRNPAGIGNNQLHFFSYVLHEVGHVVGLCDQNDTHDVMYFTATPGPEPGGGPWFTGIDADSEHGVRDLYSVPAPDFGDAWDPPYPTLSPRAPAVDNGARSLFIGREWLGPNTIGETTTTWEWEARQGLLCCVADWPDDGCFGWILPPWGVGGIGSVNVMVSVTNWQSLRYNNTFGYELYLAIWIDWNGNGWWDHPGEMVVFDRLRPSTWGLNTWVNTYLFVVPDFWHYDCARARLVYTNTGINLFPWGLIPTFQSPDNGGEVEDYYEIHACTGDLGGPVNFIPTFFAYDGKVNAYDLALFIYCYKKLAPPEAMCLADLGGGMPPRFVPDGKVDAIDIALWIACYKRELPP